MYLNASIFFKMGSKERKELMTNNNLKSNYNCHSACFINFQDYIDFNNLQRS